MEISFGLHTNDTDCSLEPDAFVALILKSAVPVKFTFEMVTVLPEKLKATDDPFLVTVMLCFSETFSTVAVMEALQSSDVTVEVDGEVIVTTGSGIAEHVPCVSPCAWCAGHADSGIVMFCGLSRLPGG